MASRLQSGVVLLRIDLRTKCNATIYYSQECKSAVSSDSAQTPRRPRCSRNGLVALGWCTIGRPRRRLTFYGCSSTRSFQREDSRWMMANRALLSTRHIATSRAPRPSSRGCTQFHLRSSATRCISVRRPWPNTGKTRLTFGDRAGGYHRRSFAESAMHRLKAAFGQRLRSRQQSAQAHEALLRAHLLNRWPSPATVPVA